MKPDGIAMFLLAAVVAMVAAGCGTAEREKEPPAAEAGSATSAAAGRDISSLDVCKLVPGEEVAALLGGTLDQEPRSQIYTGASTECDYQVKAGSRIQAALVFLYPPSYFEFGAEEGERREIDGLGDRAYAAYDGGIYQVMVLVKGDVTIDARADSADEARRLAELTLSKL